MRAGVVAALIDSACGGSPESEPVRGDLTFTVMGNARAVVLLQHADLVFDRPADEYRRAFEPRRIRGWKLW